MAKSREEWIDQARARMRTLRPRAEAWEEKVKNGEAEKLELAVSRKMAVAVHAYRPTDAPTHAHFILGRLKQMLEDFSAEAEIAKEYERLRGEVIKRETEVAAS